MTTTAIPLYLYGLHDFEPNDGMICMDRTGRCLQVAVTDGAPGRLARFAVDYNETVPSQYNSLSSSIYKCPALDHDLDAAIETLLVHTAICELSPVIYGLPRPLEVLVAAYLAPGGLDDASVLINRQYGTRSWSVTAVAQLPSFVTLSYEEQVTRLPIPPGSDPRLLVLEHRWVAVCFDAETGTVYNNYDVHLHRKGIRAVPLSGTCLYEFAFVSRTAFDLFDHS